jgi:4-hydroxyacetophenone monooxygenase
MWDEETSTWEIREEHPDDPCVWRVYAVISCVRFLARPDIPEIAGMEDFAGQQFHSAVKGGRL